MQAKNTKLLPISNLQVVRVLWICNDLHHDINWLRPGRCRLLEALLLEVHNAWNGFHFAIFNFPLVQIKVLKCPSFQFYSFFAGFLCLSAIHCWLCYVPFLLHIFVLCFSVPFANLYTGQA